MAAPVLVNEYCVAVDLPGGSLAAGLYIEAENAAEAVARARQAMAGADYTPRVTRVSIPASEAYLRATRVAS